MSSPVQPDVLRDALVPWYREHARDLPWRREVSPYRTLLSELMLQQTRVDTVIPYFERFVERWPTLDDLAAASQDEVLTMWAGLGYYRRARFLHRAAVAASALGGLPSTPKELATLPGIGAYTSGAIASIAFGVVAAAVDGNVERVLSRVDGRREDPKSTPGKKALTARALSISAEGVASEVTQGLMELGATVCTPRSPTCGTCPWEQVCVARALGVVDEIPMVRKRTKNIAISGVAAIIRQEGRVLMGRRPPGLLGGMWEPIMVLRESEEAPRVALERLLKQRAGLRLRHATAAGRIKHVFTHRTLTLEVFEVHADGEPGPTDEAVPYVDMAWHGDGDDRALSKLARKVLALQPALPLPVAAEGSVNTK